MTRKHYVQAAKIIGNVAKGIPFSSYRIKVLTELLRGFGDMFESDNPRFDRVRFTEACWERYREEGIS